MSDMSDSEYSEYVPDEEEYIPKPTKTRKPTVKASTNKASSSKVTSSKASSNKSLSSKASAGKTTSNKATTSKVTSSKATSSKAASSKFTSSKASSTITPFNEISSNKTATQAKKTVEEIYQKKTQLEHILLRPDTYVGSVQASAEKLWVYDSIKNIMVYKEINYVPGLYKIVDEILVNAADNKIRDPSMDTIKVVINQVRGEISIYNNGNGIPIEIHKEENVWVPELIFGHLLTSSNYNDDERKVTGGRNGYGAKLANIFSTQFIVETVDSSIGKKYRQIFRDNMTVTEPPEISPYSKKEEYTMITFKPDFQKFNMHNGLDDDFISLLKKRVYDLAGVVKDVKVFLDNERVRIKNFKDYVLMYLNESDEVDLKSTIIYEEVNPRWEIAFFPSPEGSFQHISFVNSICTSKGGSHVNYIADQIIERLMIAVSKKAKDAKLMKKNQIKNHMWLFINCLIENPSFDSQTKETLTLRASSFGSKCNPSDAFYNKLLKSKVVESILEDGGKDAASARYISITIPTLTSKDKYKVRGKIEPIENKSEVRITELPIRVWTQSYKEQLEQWIAGTDKVPAWIIEYNENHTITNVDFTVKLTENNFNDALEEGLEKKFKLTSIINTSNMVCFDGKGRIKKYTSAEEILREFYDYRLEYYYKRKEYMLKVLEVEVNKLRNKVRFIQMKINHDLKYEGLRKADIIKLLESKGFERFKNSKEENNDDDESGDGDGYNYLMNTKSWSFCKEDAQKLVNKRVEKELELAELQNKTPQMIWKEDLNNFLEEWNKLLENENRASKENRTTKRKMK
ncbi:13082_t:CDS:2 [Funneliformis mosseae]|uniref:DNA topoisomerase 2 n=1 Tax=Funneliformis mosseae TaxID=27381 RepID=A0A9N9BB28_FUNMO|nr:13082_t:CDS:2 [Funneliformis mosseae]